MAEVVSSESIASCRTLPRYCLAAGSRARTPGPASHESAHTRSPWPPTAEQEDIVTAAVEGAHLAVLAGTGAAYLARRDGASYPKAIVRAAATAAATLTLAAVVTTALAAVLTLSR